MVMLDRSLTPSDEVWFSDEREIEGTIQEAKNWLAGCQADDGHWAFELEADATIPSEYIFLNHFLGDIDDETEQSFARYLLSIQGKHGGWTLY